MVRHSPCGSDPNSILSGDTRCPQRVRSPRQFARELKWGSHEIKLFRISYPTYHPSLGIQERLFSHKGGLSSHLDTVQIVVIRHTSQSDAGIAEATLPALLYQDDIPLYYHRACYGRAIHERISSSHSQPRYSAQTLHKTIYPHRQPSSQEWRPYNRCCARYWFC